MKKLLLVTISLLFIGCSSDDVTEVQPDAPRTTCYDASNQMQVPSRFQGKWRNGFDNWDIQSDKIIRNNEQYPNIVGQGTEGGDTYYVQFYESDINFGDYYNVDYHYVRLVFKITTYGDLRYFYRLYDYDCYEVYTSPLLYFSKLD